MRTQKLYAFFVVTLIFIIVLASGCGRKGRSIGADDVIAVIANPVEFERLEEPLKEVFEREIRVPIPELTFTLKNVSLDDFDTYRKWKSLIIISTLDSKSQVLPFIKSMLNPLDLAKVENKQSFAFNKKEPWAYDQQLIVLVSTDIPTLKEKLAANKEQLFNVMDDYLTSRVKREMYATSEQVALEKELSQKYGWKIRIQHDFEVLREDSAKSFVLLQRKLPSRSFLIHWVDTADPSIMTREWIIKRRNDLSLNFEDADTVDVNRTETSTVDFGRHKALKLTGLWYSGFKGGGPFRSYTFYDERDRRIYTLDYAMFQPDFNRRKLPFLRQLDIMAHTFKAGSE
ncbi:DUF4837 family protein [candidate division KSB1 bacterium]|nr:DUF4837 family protein [candidate division KSB1 bacterium]